MHIDYSEEVEESYIRDIQQKLAYVENELSHIYHISLTRQSIIEGYTLSIIGKPNVGKSSLLNALLRYERAIVSEIEGTTRDTIEEMLTIKGSLLRIVDTAGIRESDDKIEQIGILKTKEVFSIGAVMAIITIVFLWIIFAIFMRMGNARKLIALGITFLLAIPFLFMINAALASMIAEPICDIWDMVTVSVLLISAFVSFICNFGKKKK